MHVRVFLSRWRGYRTCPDCEGKRLRPEALAVKVGGMDIAALSALTIDEVLAFLRGVANEPEMSAVRRRILDGVLARLDYLDRIGLDYLTLDRQARTLSGGEARRVALTTALGSGLVNTLYVLDEPSIGLHPRDVGRLVVAIERLRDAGNTVAVVEHEEAVMRSADLLVDIGPGAGEAGGRVVLCRTARRDRGGAAVDHGRVPVGTTPRGDLPHASEAEGVDHARRSPRAQPAGDRRRVPPGIALRGDRRQRGGQEHARRGDALSGLDATAPERTPSRRTLPRDPRGQRARRRRPDRPVPHRPHAAVEPGDLPEGVRRDPQDRSPRPTRPGFATTAPASSASTSKGAAAMPARGTAISSSTCSSSPT